VTVLAEARVRAPDTVLLLARLRRAPTPPTPLPLSVIGSAIVRPVPSTPTVAPLDTVVVPAAVPKAALARARTVPLPTVTAPVNVLAALRMSVPEPLVVRPPAPLMMPPRRSWAPASVTVTGWTAATAKVRLIVFEAPTALSVSPPAPSVTWLPARV